MKVYQLKLKEHDLILDPVFKSLKGINLYKNKYNNRKVEIVEKNIEISNLEYIYRISMSDDDGGFLIESLFETLEKAQNFIKSKNIKSARIVKEYFSSENKIYESFVEV